MSSIPHDTTDDSVQRIDASLSELLGSDTFLQKKQDIQSIPPKEVETQFETLSEIGILAYSSATAAEMLLMPVEGGLQKHLIPKVPNPPSPPSLLNTSMYRLNWSSLGKEFKTVLTQRAPVTGLLMTSYEWVKQKLKQRLPDLSSPVKVGLVAGPTAQFLESTIWQPIATMQSRGEPIKSIIAQGGVKSLYRGFWNSYFASMPMIAALFASSEYFGAKATQKYQAKHPGESIPISWLLGTGVAAGAVAVIVSTPLESLRQAALKEWKNRGQSREIIKQQGFKSWLVGHDGKGFLSRIAQDMRTSLFRQAPRTGTRKVLFAAIKGSPARVVLRQVLRSVARSSVRAFARGGGARQALKLVMTRIARIVLRRGK